MSCQKSVCSLLGVVIVSLLFIGALQAATYQHSLKIDKMTFDWSIEGENIAIKISAPTTGWVGIGFNPTDTMKGANIILGLVKDGKVEISDEFGTQITQHVPDAQKGGKDNVTVVGGNETGNTTTLEFSIPLKSGDPNDGVIDPKGNTLVMLAYGPSMKSTRIKHQYAKTITVNLDSGAMK